MTSILNNINICSEIPQNIKIILKSLYVFKRYSDTNIIIITKEDKVYVLGVNYYGLLGLGDIEQVNDFEECKELSGQMINDLFFGHEFALGLNKTNELFGWGSNEYGQLARGYRDDCEMKLKPEKIEFPRERIYDICCGYQHILILTSNGLYGWGNNCDGQLGLIEEKVVTTPCKIKISDIDEKFKYIYCCCGSSFAITTNGILFSWGYNEDGFLGQGVEGEICLPRKINLFNVQKICAGGDCNYFLTNDGFIYFCNEEQKTPKNLEESKIIFTDLDSVDEYNCYCDAEKIFYKLYQDRLEMEGNFESFVEFFAKKIGVTKKLFLINNEKYSSED